MAGTVTFLMVYALQPFISHNIEYSLPSSQKRIGTLQMEYGEPEHPSPSDYLIIAEENLFHPDRIIPREKKEEQQLPRPEFVLYGTMIHNNTSFAFLEDQKAPRTTPGRGKRQVTLRIGDMLSGYRLKAVYIEKIVMVRGDDEITLFVHDPKHPKKRDSFSAPTATSGATPQPIRPQTQTKSPVRSQRQAVPQPFSPKTDGTSGPRAPMTPADEKVIDFFRRQ